LFRFRNKRLWVAFENTVAIVMALVRLCRAWAGRESQRIGKVSVMANNPQNPQQQNPQQKNPQQQNPQQPGRQQQGEQNRPGQQQGNSQQKNRQQQGDRSPESDPRQQRQRLDD
jgi:hypothetical protein